MKDLHVFDVSSVVYVGANTKFFRDRTFYNYPVGGVHFFMRYLTNAIVKRDDVVLCFDSPSFRNELLQTYKKGRVKNHAVISQLETLYEELQSINIACEKIDGFEADDIIDGAVTQRMKDYYEVFIYSNDMDLCHSVRGNVMLRPLRIDKPNVTYNNFSRCVEPGKTILFNTISAYKSLTGCKSDAIPALKLECGMTGSDVYRDLLNFLQKLKINLNYELTSSPKLLPTYAEYRKFFSEIDKENLAKQIELVYPKDVAGEIIPVDTCKIDKEMLAMVLRKYGDKESLRCIGEYKYGMELSEITKNSIKEKARLLNTGEFAADRNLEFQKVDVSTLRIDSFSKDY